MKALSIFRRKLKEIGFSFSIKTLSFGRSITYKQLETKAELTGNVFTHETLKKWAALSDWLNENQEFLKKLQEEEILSSGKIYGLNPFKK